MKRISNKHSRLLNDQRGSVLVIFVLLLMVLLGFTALAAEAGRWYAVRVELSKAVDAAALTAARNISNPYVSLAELVDEVGRENFSPGHLGSVADSLNFTMTRPDTKKVKVEGNVNALAMLARVWGIDTVATSSSGVGERNKVEIMMVLDRSGSMSGTPLSDLKEAATSFLSFFTETQEEDKMGLISFATGVTVNRPLETYFVNDMTTKINAMTATGATNAEDAIDHADGPGGFTDQTIIPPDQRVQQFLIFFTDGHPTAFRGNFRRNATDYDAVVMSTGNCNLPSDTVYNYMGHTDSENFYTPTGQPTGTSLLPPTPTGDGNKTSGSPLTSCGALYNRYLNTRWYIFGDAKYGLTGYGPVQCSIPTSVLGGNTHYLCITARQMAIDHAQELKDKNIKIYTIGLGNNVDTAFLGQVASGSDFEYYAPNSSELEAIFNKIAKEITLRLVQ
jgi:Mg-chelatase subunit ChlD